MQCYCGSEKLFEECCEPFIKRISLPTTPEALMRSRYSAYCCGDADYLLLTTHPTTRRLHNKAEIRAWSKQNKWTKLEVILAKGDLVCFKAHYFDINGHRQVHYEKSRFMKHHGKWYYLDGTFVDE